MNELPFEVTGEGSPSSSCRGSRSAGTRSGSSSRCSRPGSASWWRTSAASRSADRGRRRPRSAAACATWGSSEPRWSRTGPAGASRRPWRSTGAWTRTRSCCSDPSVPPEGPALPETAEDALARAHVEPLADADADAYLERWRRDPARTRGVALSSRPVTTSPASRTRWPRGSSPCSCSTATSDRIVDPGIAERLSAAIPASTLGFVPESGHLLLDDAFDTIGVMILEYLRARYLRAPHDHGGITTLQLERRPGWVDLTAAEADDADGSAAPDPSEQEVGPNA